MTTSIYPILKTSIETILNGIPKIKEVHFGPETKITKYPAAVLYPSTIQNDFETTVDNFKIYGFKLWIVANAKGTTTDNLFGTVMPNTLDAVLQALDEGWDLDAIAGHRVWLKVDTGNWTLSDEQGGVELSVEIDLSVKMLTG